MDPCVGLGAEYGNCLRFSFSHSLCSSPPLVHVCTCSLSLKKEKKKNHKEEKILVQYSIFIGKKSACKWIYALQPIFKGQPCYILTYYLYYANNILMKKQLHFPKQKYFSEENSILPFFCKFFKFLTCQKTAKFSHLLLHSDHCAPTQNVVS